MSDSEEDRRRKEINLFAAMALGEEAAADDDYLMKPSSTTKPQTCSSVEQPKDTRASNAGGSRDMFAAAAAAEPGDSGTFALSSRSNKHAEQSNFDKAVATLTDKESTTTTTIPLNVPFLESPRRRPRTTEEEDIPMFHEEVVMQRPLFFGAVLPPRVLLEARDMVKRAQEELGYDGTGRPPRLSELPPAVRNVVGAIRTYGFGLDVLQDDNNDDEEKDEEFWRGSSYISTFQPVWDDHVRAERVKEYRKKRKPDIIARVKTAPARMYTSQGELPEELESPTTKTEAGQPSGDEREASSNRMSANDQFSMWLRGDDDSAVGSQCGLESIGSMRSLESVASPKDSSSGDSPEKASPKKPLTEQEIFSQWARGSDANMPMPMSNEAADSGFNGSTFQRMPNLQQVDSDDDSILDDESKKQVGVNDHLSKAIESLAGGGDGQPPADLTAEESKALLSQVPLDESRKRPLTNYELTNGCVPLFGVDDPPLPVEGDLGKYDTKEEQMKCNEQKRSQDIIERFVAPNVFGPIACPNPALNPDDCHSWNSRSSTGRRLPRMPSGASLTSDNLSLPSARRPGHQAQDSTASSVNTAGNRPTTPQPKPPKESAMKKKYASRTRYGWWNFPEQEEGTEKQDQASEEGKTEMARPEPKLQVPPLHHSAETLQVTTLLEPKPQKLREDNLPLSRMHAATSMAQTLPYLSDRPHSYRYLQIDTQAVGFPPIGGEVEPLFCSLAVYNVDTVSSGAADRSAAPIPDLRRCGRVTEALNFDVVSDQEIANRCAGALWPYAASSENKDEPSDRLQGTRCGVFPLPSNLNVSSLYAVLIVSKVLSDDGGIDPYLKSSKNPVEISRLKARSEKACHRHGNILVPFCFGVAPLLQVFGADIPVVASSRAVQIPLFRFSPGLGERQIVDHIMVMLYPRADHRANGIGGPAAISNGGSAMLVMRNFGYLGLHAVVDKKSSLARDRLVDFTGELQLRRKREDELSETKGKPKSDNIFATVLPEWHSQFVAEPSFSGGRNLTDPPAASSESGSSRSQLYAQELAPLPLQLTPTARGVTTAQPGMPRGRLQGHDMEPFYHTTFCNEMLFHPRLLHNCPKGNIVIKAELREIEWNQDLCAYFAHLPSFGPSIHNNRRGPFLVQESFTSCSPRGGDPHFMDEFKAKLPLDLKPRRADGTSRTLSILFTVYNVKLGSKSKWKRAKKMFGEASSDVEDFDSLGKTRMQQIACGFLPVTTHACTMLDNGMHDVRIIYGSSPPPKEKCDEGVFDATTLVLFDKTDITESLGSNADRDDSYAEETTISHDSTFSDWRNSESGTRARTESSGLSVSDIGSIAEDSRGGRKIVEPISLSVRVVVHSSLHSQNETLAEFLHQEPDCPRFSQIIPNSVFISTITMGRDLILSTIEKASMNETQQGEEKLLEFTIDITKHQLCSLARSTGHLLRVMSILWRSLICGNGEPGLVWANPAAPASLRVHSFATILHLLGAATIYMSKNGVTQVDGGSKWNVVTLGRVIALMFDERKLFGPAAYELFDEEQWKTTKTSADESSKCPSTAPQSKKVPKRRHVRQNYDLFNDLPPREEPSTLDTVSPNGTIAPPTLTRGSSAPALHSSPPRSSSQTPSTDATSTDKRPTQPKVGMKIDTKSDFQSALRAAAAAPDDTFHKSESDGRNKAKAMIDAFGAVSGGGRRWMTAPSRALSTIRELEDGDADEAEATLIGSEGTSETHIDSMSSSAGSQKDSLDDELVVNSPKKSVKQMRVPKLKKAADDSEKAVEIKAPIEALTLPGTQMSLPTSDKEIETAGSAFLEVIGKSLGLSSNAEDVAEERHVGSSHHTKTRSRCSSIDWTLIGDGRVTSSPSPLLDATEEHTKDTSDDLDEMMSTLRKEESTYVKLPNFVDRLTIMGKSSEHTARWFPFAYEVIIMQWAAILIEQRVSGEKGGPDRQREASSSSSSNSSRPGGDGSLTQAALRSVGVAIAGAPMLFEVIKQSLGFRVSTLFGKRLSKQSARACPPLVTLDDTMLVSLEQIISMVADACIDSRNFDSWDLRQMSIDVNDSIVRFLRDMFSFLTPSSVHRLMLAYLSRFVTKEGKQWQDRDSSIGLRCSWEITKLRLNAVTALIRFPDFVRVNGPQMLNWGDWRTTAPAHSSDRFFDDVLERYCQYNLPGFAGNEGTMQKVDIPKMRPHWLAEIVVDVCLLGTEHAEQYIQHRSASLLHEMFWASSQESILNNTAAPIASMYLTFLEKLLVHVTYLSNFAPKSQLRKDVLPCAVFVIQSCPANLLRALWRRLCVGLAGKGFGDKFDGTGGNDARVVREGDGDNHSRLPESSVELKEEPDILDVFSLLNLSIRTIEYEGADEHFEADSAGDGRENIELWRREILLSQNRGGMPETRGRRRNEADPRSTEGEDGFSSSISRKWQAHDGSLVIIDTANQIVWELFTILSESRDGEEFLNPALIGSQPQDRGGMAASAKPFNVSFAYPDIVVFVRAATSLYLHALALRQGDIVAVKTFKVTAEIIKIFGIKIFLEAVGETLQHWMRVISIHCGARRSHVRVEATDLLELVLRSTWECFGSFFRIRVPLLAVQTEVMERIVATAAARYYRDQRRVGTTFETFSNVCAEASLVPLWRTLDRIEKQPASQNIAFRGALIRMAGKLKKLYRAYVAARVLSFIQGARLHPEESEAGTRDHETETLMRANRINILRVLNASEGYSKQFLGFQGTQHQRSNVAHYEAVEDALIEAADVFSPTELPEHRVAWLRMLADFHASRQKYAEEATCHFHIHVTLQQAARLHGSLWSNTPFLPWTDNIPDPVYIDGDAPTVDPDSASEFELDETDGQYGRSMDNASSFRRIFYRVANSVGMTNEEWENGVSKSLFCGITFPFEYHTLSPWITLREMEEDMVEEAESAGDLFLKAGIIESSRLAWNLATQYYAEKFNYPRLAIAYGNLAKTVVSRVPPIDPTLPQEVSATLGRFYRVWFHGGAPDELTGVEFVYRTEGAVRLEQFGEELREVIKSIIPDKAPIDLVLDGRPEERIEDGSMNYGGFSRIGPAPLEPVRIKVTPLRPLFGRDSRIRGLPEWFHWYVDEAFSGPSHRSKSDLNRVGAPRRSDSSAIENGEVSDLRHREHARSYSASVFSSTGSSTGGAPSARRGNFPFVGHSETRTTRFTSPGESELSGVDKFCFVQPKDRSKGSKDWWKTSSGDFTEKTLKVTQLQVNHCFPACVARQAVVHRLVYSQSPLEAGVDAICQWCAVLFRTAVATVGSMVLGTNSDPGIGTDAAKIVADCIHSSHVKEIGMALLKKNSDLMEGDSVSDFLMDYDRLTEDEIKKLQVKLARLTVVFIELLHLLIARNRDILLGVIQERKKGDPTAGGGSGSTGGSSRGFGRAVSLGDAAERRQRRHHHHRNDSGYDGGSIPSLTTRDAHRRGQPVSEGGLHQRNLTDGVRSEELRPGRHHLQRNQPDDTTHRQQLHSRGLSEDNQSYASAMSASGGVRTDSAIAVQSELQRAFINLVKALYPSIHSVMQTETPRWLKQCALENYFSLGTYKQTKIPIAEELCFTASESLRTGETPGLNPFAPQGTYDRSMDSPHGSVASSHSIVSRGSDRYGFGHF